MTYLSTGAMSPNPYATKDGFVPFVVRAKFNASAGYGKRMEIISEIEKNLNILESVLTTYESSGSFSTAGDDYQIEFSKPVKYTKQFGDKPALFTVNGNLKVAKDSIAKKPAADVSVDSNSIRTGYGAINNGNRVVDAAVDAQATQLWTDLQALSTIWTITSLEYNGIKYGNEFFNRGGHTTG